MPLESILNLAEELIRIPSLSGKEREVLFLMETRLSALGWNVQKLPVANQERWNILATVGSPRVIFTTHLDVVPAPDALFTPRREDDCLFGRGACDAKGIAAVMVESATSLLKEGAKDMGLLFVVDEEALSIGAKAAAPILKELGVRYLIDGEPTDCFVAAGHKGVLTMEANFRGRSAHSGYPELGDDANARLIRFGSKILEADLGFSHKLGKATANLGMLSGGVATNVVSPQAQMKISVRVVTDTNDVYEKVKQLLPENTELKILGRAEPVELRTVSGFETKIVSYGTDIPHLLPSGAECLLYGPGSIFVAHTDEEHVSFSELLRSYEGYRKLYRELSR